MFKKTLGLAVVATVAIASQAVARDQIRIVGSSTVFPFSTTVAETFGNKGNFKTPVVESTGSGGGLKLFCAGIGVEHPDITNASRRIKKSEVEKCAKAGITDITEVKVGFDGIVVANAKSAAPLNLTKKQIFMALAKQVPIDGKLVDNPYKTWKDVDPSLPNTAIKVFGPPPTSGTRDAFAELALEGGAKAFPSLKALRKSDKKAFKAIAHAVREDNVYVETGENDNLIVQKLVAEPTAVGVFGFSFLDQNADQIQGAKVGGVEPTFENISSGDYGISRSLFFYVKNAHVGTVPGIKEYIAEFTSEDAFGEFGYLTEKGLIPLSEEERAKVRDEATSLTNLKMM
ncbi:substrate-binding domain-containing protein [Sneathiella glossodoripedis]|uniref:substrate-binding domain-containing protein n=1 Tax=Sneathiella glossodoripedis TaxID=418853 RepID=UPI0004718717|nr:substrate-binding domain-containing protein [Sneathiella glossodoripedis]